MPRSLVKSLTTHLASDPWHYNKNDVLIPVVSEFKYEILRRNSIHIINCNQSELHILELCMVTSLSVKFLNTKRLVGTFIMFPSTWNQAGLFLY